MLYVGPDQIIPLSGFFGTVFGLALIFWGKLAQGFRKVTTAFSGKKRDLAEADR